MSVDIPQKPATALPVSDLMVRQAFDLLFRHGTSLWGYNAMIPMPPGQHYDISVDLPRMQSAEQRDQLIEVMKDLLAYYVGPGSSSCMWSDDKSATFEVHAPEFVEYLASRLKTYDSGKLQCPQFAPLNMAGSVTDHSANSRINYHILRRELFRDGIRGWKERGHYLWREMTPAIYEGIRPAGSHKMQVRRMFRDDLGVAGVSTSDIPDKNGAFWVKVPLQQRSALADAISRLPDTTALADLRSHRERLKAARSHPTSDRSPA